MSGKIDLVTAEVIQSAMETIAFEMNQYVARQATTPILTASNELNSTIMDGHGRLAAISAGSPQLMLSSTLPVRAALEFFGDELLPGDVILGNDPYHGGGHLPDFHVFAPVFCADGKRRLIASMQCHHGDTGGASQGGYNVNATDIYTEGTRYPMLKIIEGGKERRDVVELLRANNRLPGFIGDIQAQVGAAQLGARRLADLMDRYGADTVEQVIEEAIADSRRRFSKEIAAWPDGTYESDVWVDCDIQGNKDIHVHVAITVKGDRLTVDFEGSDTRPNIAAWSTYGNSRGNALAQLMSVVDPTIPKNEGFFDCVDMRIPKNSCINPPVGKPVASGHHHPGVEVTDAVALAMAKFLPERVSPQSYKYGSPRQMWGIDPRNGKPFHDHGGEVNAGWCNGIKGVDGWGALAAAFGNLMKAPAELNEVNFPHILRNRNYLTDSGGAGEWRGGLGSLFVKEVRGPTYINQYVVNQRHIHPGIAGGKSGAPDEAILAPGTDHELNVSPSVGKYLLNTGEQLVYKFGGGGGWGDPLLRDSHAVLEDVWDEYVSIEGARRDYGVVIMGSLESMDLKLDEAATADLRAALKGATAAA